MKQEGINHTTQVLAATGRCVSATALEAVMISLSPERTYALLKGWGGYYQKNKRQVFAEMWEKKELLTVGI